jgi:hypothetical protein
MPTTATFETGRTYTTRFACDASMVLSYTVVKRTAKFVTLETPHGETVRVGIKTDDEGEWALPQGSYSMAPVIRASRSA